MQKLMNVPRVVISAPQGQCGKTTITIGLIGALVSLGYQVQPFKKGPDFIDPSWLSLVAGRRCRNLDCFFMDPETMVTHFVQGTTGSDVAVIEGAMGLYDGIDLQGSGSTAQIAKNINSPVLLVIDCRRMTRSVAAMVMGYKGFDPAVNVAGVILNNVARSRHRQMLTRAIEEYCAIPVLGSIPKDSDLAIPNRHLGLVPVMENDHLQDRLNNIVAVARANLDLDRILQVARQAPLLPVREERVCCRLPSGRQVKIGIIQDRSFSFYYPENLEYLERAGARLVYIDALQSSALPELDGLFIGGGFPEVFASQLADNQLFRKSIAENVARGLPVYAECGGLMYLGQSIINDGCRYPMVGVLPFDVTLEAKPQGHGYTVMQVVKDNPFFSLHATVRGHEFHNSRLVNLDRTKVDFAFKVQRGHGIDGEWDGILYKNVLASYNHIHAVSVKEWAQNLVAAARTYKLNNTLKPTCQQAI